MTTQDESSIAVSGRLGNLGRIDVEPTVRLSDRTREGEGEGETRRRGRRRDEGKA
jgi:hypothetical protein